MQGVLGFRGGVRHSLLAATRPADRFGLKVDAPGWFGCATHSLAIVPDVTVKLDVHVQYMLTGVVWKRGPSFLMSRGLRERDVDRGLLIRDRSSVSGLALWSAAPLGSRCRGPVEEIVKPTGLEIASEKNHVLRVLFEPVLRIAFEPEVDDPAYGALDCPTAKTQPSLAEGCLPHPRSVGLEVADVCLDTLRSTADGERADVIDQDIDLASLEQLARGLRPRGFLHI